jgi:uncharacterized membrane protein YfhO
MASLAASMIPRSACDAYLVLTDSWDPGWRVRVDGHDSRAFVVDSMFRAARVEAGEHEVAFDYAPGGYAAGSALTLLGLGLCALLLVRPPALLRI